MPPEVATRAPDPVGPGPTRAAGGPESGAAGDVPPTAEVDIERNVFRGAALGLSGLWTYRHLFLALLVRDVRVRYRHAWLGFAWAVIQPTLMMAVFTLFLGPRVANPDIPYPVFVYSGFLVWTFFSTALQAASLSVLSAERLVTKAHFPRLVLPWASAGAILIDLLGAGVGLTVLMAWFGLAPSWQVILAPLALVFVGLAAGGVGTLFAALNVQFWDFRFLVPFGVQLWLFATPVLFIQGLEPPPAAGVAGAGALSPGAVLSTLNPLTGLIAFFRAAALGGPLPWERAGLAALFSVVLAVLACWYFRRVEHRFADII